MNKKLTRLTALLLAVLLLTSTLGTALADTLTRDQYGQALQQMQDDLNLIPENVPGGIEKESTVTGTKLVPVAVPVAGGISVTDSVVLTNPETPAASYQWQIDADGVWANIAGETGESLVLTYAMAINALTEENTVVLYRLRYDAEGALLEKYDKFVVPVSTEFEYKQEPTKSTLGVTQYTQIDEDEQQQFDEAWDFQNTARNPVSTFALTREADTPELKNYNVIINYVFENNEVAADPYTASIAAGLDFAGTVPNPVILGYLPYYNDVESKEISLNITNIQEDAIYTVVYKPTIVNYTVIHYRQNPDNDKYTIFETETRQGLTNSTVSEVKKDGQPGYEGFYSLLYEKPAIAADGSTVVEVYYDRNYYLMLFELDDGYGVDPIYARYGAAIEGVGEPERAGWSFAGWSETEGGAAVSLPATMPASESGKTTYYALWNNPQQVNYTVVYWRENADDDGYSYWGSAIKTVTAGTLISGADDVPTSVSNATIEGNTVNEKQYFTYNSILTDKNVEIKGDGTSVVNVYYTRNEYTIYFKGYGTCALPVHTHGDDCEPELICRLTEHTHSDACCDAVHATHTTSCWRNVGDRITNTNGYPNNPQNGQLYVYRDGYIIQQTRRRIYINGSWYNYTANSGSNGTIIQPSCSGVHVHGDADCECNQREHSHDSSCYSYECGLDVHTHTNTCNSNNTGNTIYVLTAKYNQNISAVWPTAEKLAEDGHAHTNSDGDVVNASNQLFRGWSIDGVSSTATSKRVNMTTDLCDASDGVKNATATYDADYTVTLYYMFESFDQTSAANGNERKQYTFNRTDTRYYDSDSRYYQVVNADSSSFNQKEIMGMNPVGVQSERVGGNGSTTYNNFLYYTRNRYTLTFQNVDTVVWTVNNIMFEQPLNGYKANGVDVSTFELDNKEHYPEGFEKDAYVFAGWYTTPECYSGTEFDFTNAIMPNGNLALYAKWAPVLRTVTFYLDEEDMADGESSIADTHPQVNNVPHGTVVTFELEEPENGDYNFVGWFYKDANGEEKAFDFANMRVSHDLEVYGKWSSNVLKKYIVYFKAVTKRDADGKPIDGVEIADPISGSTLAGMTKTFDAKGGTDLYSDYRTGYFPDVQSHSLTISIDDPDNEGANTCTFWYVQEDAVPYTVYYVAETLKHGENPADYQTIEIDGKTYYKVADTKVVSDNHKAVVTEKFEVVQGYMPDAYQKRLVVVKGADNEIVFYYTPDSQHAYYKITHYTRNTDGENWTEYASSEAKGVIGESYSADPLTIAGFTYKAELSNTSGRLTADGLELKLYYERNPYPYEVRYLEKGTGKQLADPKRGTELYGKVISESAINIEGYTAVDPTSQTLSIKIDEGEGAPRNIITFYYVENDVTINYEVVGPEGCGTVDPASETVKVLSGTAQGSTAAAAGSAYKFVGWYSDEACTKLLSTDAKFVPEKVNGKNVAATYYAKFDWNVGTLNIYKKVLKDDFSDSETFTFTVYDETGAVAKRADGTDARITITVTAKNQEFYATISDLLYVGSGKYKVVESAGANGYTTTMTDGKVSSSTTTLENVSVPAGGAATVKVVNTASENREITVTKNWVDHSNALGYRPNGISLTLSGNGVNRSESDSTSSKNGDSDTWTYTWNVPKYDANGNTINYTVSEGDVTNYTTAIDGFTVTNTLALGQLTITKSGIQKIDDHAASGNAKEERQSSIFRVQGVSGTNTAGIDVEVAIEGNGSATVGFLPAGQYTVTEISGWAWRYEPKAGTVTVTVTENGTASVEFENQRDKAQWLSGDCYRENNFGKYSN